MKSMIKYFKAFYGCFMINVVFFVLLALITYFCGLFKTVPSSYRVMFILIILIMIIYNTAILVFISQKLKRKKDELKNLKTQFSVMTHIIGKFLESGEYKRINNLIEAIKQEIN